MVENDFTGGGGGIFFNFFCKSDPKKGVVLDQKRRKFSKIVFVPST